MAEGDGGMPHALHIVAQSLLFHVPPAKRAVTRALMSPRARGRRWWAECHLACSSRIIRSSSRSILSCSISRRSSSSVCSRSVMLRSARARV